MSNPDEIIQQIQLLQNQEIELYAELERSVLSGQSSSMNDVVEKIQQTSALKRTLYDNLAVDLKKGRDTVSQLSDQLERDIHATNVIEKQVEQARQRASSHANIVGNKTRLIEMGMYEAERYQVHKTYFIYLIMFLVGLIVVVVLLRFNVIPSMLGSMLITLLIVGAIIMSISQLYDMSQRSSLDYSKYNWQFDPAEASKNYETVWEHDVNSMRQIGRSIDTDIHSGAEYVSQHLNTHTKK